MIAFTLDTSGALFDVRYLALLTGVFLAWRFGKWVAGWNTITRAQRKSARPWEQLARREARK